MLSAEIDKIGGQTRIRKRVREPVMTMDDDIEGGQMRIRKRVREISPENEMAYILPYPFEMDEEDHKKVIKRIGGFRIARVILCNHQKCGKGFWDWSAIAIAKTTIPFLLKKAIMLFTNNTVDIEMIYEAIKPLIEVLGKEGIKFMMIHSKKGIKWIMKNLQKKVSDIRKKEIKILSKIKNTKKGNGKRGGSIMLDEFIMKHHKRLGKGFNESFMNGLLWVNKKILAPIAQTVLPPVLNTAVAKTFDVVPQYLAERMPGNYEYEDPSKPNKADKQRDKEEKFKKYYEATHQKPREAKEEKASSQTLRTAGKIFDKNKSFWENHLQPLAEPLGEIALSAVADYTRGALMGKPSVMGNLIHGNRQAPAPARILPSGIMSKSRPNTAPKSQAEKDAIKATVKANMFYQLADQKAKQAREELPVAYPVGFNPPRQDVFQGRTLHFNPASHEIEMKMPGGQTEMKMPSKGDLEMKMPARERRGTVPYLPEQIPQVMPKWRTEKRDESGRGRMRKGDGRLSSWWKKHKGKILKGLAIGAVSGAVLGHKINQRIRRQEVMPPSSYTIPGYDRYNELHQPSYPPAHWREGGGSFWQKHKSKILGTLALGTTLGATALIGSKINRNIRSQPVLQPSSYTIPGYGVVASRANVEEDDAFDAPPESWYIPSQDDDKKGGSCCRACKMKKGKCKKGKGWWSDNKAKILGGISGAATLAGMAYVGNKLYGSKSNEPASFGHMEEYDPAKYKHLNDGYEDV
jgi:hypothetical protein